MRFIQAYDGDWIRPAKRNYKIACCDCGLVHKMKFRVVDGDVEIQATRDVKATYSRRRNKKHKNQKL